MNVADFTEGLSLIWAHYEDPSGFHLCAEHDCIYLSPTERKLTDQEVKILHDLGWTQEGVEEGGYDQSASWLAYV